MCKKHPEQNGRVQPGESCSGTERWYVQTGEASDLPDQYKIDSRMVGLVTGSVIAEESHPIVAAEWMTPCNELF
jgi:hypothetical protein